MFVALLCECQVRNDYELSLWLVTHYLGCHKRTAVALIEKFQPILYNFQKELRYSRIAPPNWKKTRKLIFERDAFTCQYCGAKDSKLECDHVLPVSKGGSDDFSNLVTACSRCNRSKRDKLLDEWMKHEGSISA